MHNKTILYAHSASVIGGAERVTIAMMQDCKKYQAALLLPCRGDFSSTAEALATDIHCWPFNQPDAGNPVKLLRDSWSLLQSYRSINPQILHVGDILAYRSMKYVNALMGVPAVCHVHFPYEKSFAKWAFSRGPKPAAFVFCSEELQKNIGPYLAELCPAAKQVVIHNGIDLNRFHPCERNDSSVTRIGIIANLQYRKGHDDFLEMAKLIIEKREDVHFDVIGGDILQEPRMPFLKEKVRQMGLEDYVTFHGQLDDVTKALSMLDIVVCSSHEEAFPISMLEAMACAKAIVSTDVNGIPEALESEYNAILVKPHKPDQMVDGILRLLNDSALASTLAKNARETVELRFSSLVFSQKISQLYSELE